jgi:hypothetical protein
MECWSNGVMKDVIQVECRTLAFSNTPILQYSKKSLISLQAKPLKADLAVQLDLEESFE